MSDEVKKAIAAAESADATSGEPTIFAKIVKGEIPCTKVFENDTVLAFRDVNPQAPVHILVIPKTPIDGISTAVGSQTNLLGELMLVAGQIGKTECPNGFRLVINDGKEGAQSVYHLHVHVLGGRQMQVRFCFCLYFGFCMLSLCFVSCFLCSNDLVHCSGLLVSRECLLCFYLFPMNKIYSWPHAAHMNLRCLFACHIAFEQSDQTTAFFRTKRYLLAHPSTNFSPAAMSFGLVACSLNPNLSALSTVSAVMTCSFPRLGFLKQRDG